MTIKPPVEILIAEARQAIDAFKGCVTPIFTVDEIKARLLGTAVLIEVVDECFLCTAKHVIDENKESTLYIDGPVNFEILHGDFYSSQDHDVAVLRLTPVQKNTLKKYKPLAANDIANQLQAAASKYAEFVGFPETKNRKVFRQNRIAGEIYAIGGQVLQITSARVRVAFNPKRNIDAVTRLRVTSPDPRGMSGGAIFGVPVNDAAIKGKPRASLIGISTDWHKSSAQIFGPNIAIAMAIIKAAWHIALPPRLNPANIAVTVTRLARVEASPE
jgi:hypothetical protein